MKKSRFLGVSSIIALSLALIVGLSFGLASADGDDDKAKYEVTIMNLTGGQPFSPPVAATHRRSIKMFKVGTSASAALEEIAETGENDPMAALFGASPKVSQVVDVTMPLTPMGTVTFDIMAYEDDRFSLATMLICTNDGITGLDRVKLPEEGSITYWLKAYDAGTEKNTEVSTDIVPPCGVLGPAGFPVNDNEDPPVDSAPHGIVAPHENIHGKADLTPAHAWTSHVAKVTITRIDSDDDDDDDGDDDN